MLLSKIPLFMAIAFCFASCAGTGEGGAWTPADTQATVAAVDSTYRTGANIYRDYQAGYRNPYVAPVQPVTPVYPVAPVLYP